MDDGKVKGWWVRRRYFAEDGYLRPISGSKWQETYDPLGAARAEEERYNDSEPVYLRFARLASTAEREQFATDWGLLGMFRHELLVSRRIEPFEGIWFVVTERPGEGGSEMPYRDGEQPSEFFGVEASLGAAVFTEPFGTEVLTSSLPEKLAPYFPDLGDGVPTPVPKFYEPRWWDRYCEPLDLWDTAQAQVNRALELGSGCREWERGNTEAGELGHLFGRHLRGVHPELDCRRDKPLAWGWSFPSLYSMLWFLMLEDLTANRLKRCPCCTHWFVASRPNRFHCTDRCRATMNKRAQRAREPKNRKEQAR